MIRLIIGILCVCASTLYAAKNCLTPSGEEGTCISVYNCTEMLNMLGTLNVLNDTQIKFVQRHQCGYEKTPLVCCPIRKSITPPEKNMQDPLMNRRYCGYQHFDDYFTPTEVKRASIDEFPWMASLMYLVDGDNKTVRIACGGALITDTHVLTAAHCTVPRNYLLIGVRLGEHNLIQDIDCTDDKQLKDCNNPVEEYAIANIIIHPNYAARNHSNDIAILKLNRTVNYSDFIRPICLPFPGTKLAQYGEVLTASGWGIASYAGEQVNTKKKILVKLAPLDTCKGSLNSREKLTNKQICTEDMPNTHEFSCQGDSGGPVMFANKNQWHVEGIISFGRFCGGKNPTVNTNVVKYLEWIVKNTKL